MHVIDFEIDQGACRAVLEQQTYGTRLKEHQARRIEDPGRWCAEQALIEGPCTRKVIDVLRDLEDVHSASFAWITVELQ